jgi:hypothetical protein
VVYPVNKPSPPAVSVERLSRMSGVSGAGTGWDGWAGAGGAPRLLPVFSQQGRTAVGTEEIVGRRGRAPGGVPARPAPDDHRWLGRRHALPLAQRLLQLPTS